MANTPDELEPTYPDSPVDESEDIDEPHMVDPSSPDPYAEPETPEERAEREETFRLQLESVVLRAKAALRNSDWKVTRAMERGDLLSLTWLSWRETLREQVRNPQLGLKVPPEPPTGDA